MSFRDSLVQTAQEGISMIKNQLEQCEDSFRASKNPTMTYFGLQVQYEITKDDMGVFFRHQLYGMDAKSVAEKVWACIGDEAFDNQFPFVDVSEVLKDVDNDTKYMRRVINITASADNNTNASSSTVKEESLFVLHRAQTDDGKKVIVIRTIRNDPNRPQRHDYIRRNQCIIASFQDFKDPTGKGCLILYSVKVFIEKETNDRHNGANAPDIILRNLFEIMPTFVKALIDKARGNIPAPISNLH
jgi:hypothetical protein